MRIRLQLAVLACCAGLAACTAGPPKGPATSVTTPAVGTPQPPATIQAALSREPFTPYAAIGASDDDGLAPNESGSALAVACMSDAGYPDSPAPLAISLSTAGLAFAQPWGDWGYLGTAAAQQYGFQVPPGSVLSALGISVPPAQNQNLADLPQADQTAFGKCATIVSDFSGVVANGPLAGIQALGNDIFNDVAQDTAVKHATRAWSACMAKNGYTSPDPGTAFRQEMQSIHGTGPINPSDPVSAASNRAQIAMATSDASCTQSADLAGIYLAVQASYEKQLVDANQQALTVAARQYRAAYAKELSRLQGLLSTARIAPFRRSARSASPAPG
jgi:hypothetical protein